MRDTSWLADRMSLSRSFQGFCSTNTNHSMIHLLCNMQTLVVQSLKKMVLYHICFQETSKSRRNYPWTARDARAKTTHICFFELAFGSGHTWVSTSQGCCVSQCCKYIARIMIKIKLLWRKKHTFWKIPGFCVFVNLLEALKKRAIYVSKEACYTIPGSFHQLDCKMGPGPLDISRLIGRQMVVKKIP